METSKNFRENSDANKRYEGHFKDDKYHGKGKCAYANGDAYQGEFFDGERHGISDHRRNFDIQVSESIPMQMEINMKEISSSENVTEEEHLLIRMV